jgi:hypothetical protein
MREQFLRAVDAAIALWWAWVLLRSLLAGRIGGDKGFKSHRGQRPGQYWLWVAILALMVLHFGGLAYVGQKLPG